MLRHPILRVRLAQLKIPLLAAWGLLLVLLVVVALLRLRREEPPRRHWRPVERGIQVELIDAGDETAPDKPQVRIGVRASMAPEGFQRPVFYLDGQPVRDTVGLLSKLRRLSRQPGHESLLVILDAPDGIPYDWVVTLLGYLHERGFNRIDFGR